MHFKKSISNKITTEQLSNNKYFSHTIIPSLNKSFTTPTLLPLNDHCICHPIISSSYCFCITPFLAIPRYHHKHSCWISHFCTETITTTIFHSHLSPNHMMFLPINLTTTTVAHQTNNSIISSAKDTNK